MLPGKQRMSATVSELALNIDGFSHIPAAATQVRRLQNFVGTLGTEALHGQNLQKLNTYIAMDDKGQFRTTDTSEKLALRRLSHLNTRLHAEQLGWQWLKTWWGKLTKCKMILHTPT